MKDDDEIRADVAGGEVRLNIVSMLRSLGWKDTPENRDALCRHFITELHKRSPHMRIIAVQGGGRQN